MSHVRRWDAELLAEYSGTMQEDRLVVRPSTWNSKFGLLHENNGYSMRKVALVTK